MRIAVITQAELARSHGTGAQILQLLDGADYHHFYWYVMHGRMSEVRSSTLLADTAPRIRKVRGAVLRLKKWTGTSWWRNDNVVNRFKFMRLTESLGVPFDVAYVVVASEADASRACSLVQLLNVPYVVNVVDILHPEGLDGEKMTGFRSLVNGASAVLSLLPAITAELAKLTDAPVEEVAVGKPVSQWIARPPEQGKPVRMVLGGRPYVEGCRFLADAWGEVRQLQYPVELWYVGPHFADIPPELRVHCRDAGFMASEEEYQRFLATAHLAFLSGPNVLDQFGRFSFPSRTADYLMAGLPLLAHVAQGSSTEDVLRPLTPEAVALTRQVSDVTSGITRLVEQWRLASGSVRHFAQQTMSLDVVRESVFNALQHAYSCSARSGSALVSAV